MPQHLTALSVSRFKYPQSPLLDSVCPGLRLVGLRPKTDGREPRSWIYRFRTQDGRLRQIKLGQYPSMSLADARKAWGHQKAIRDDPSRGDPRAELLRAKQERKRVEAEAKQARYTVADLCQNYLTEHVDAVRIRQQEPRRLLEREVIPFIGSCTASTVTRAQVHELIQRIVGRGAKRVAQMVKMELRAAFNHGADSGRLPDTFSNPCDRVKAPPYKRRTRAFNEGEICEFMRWLPTAALSRSVRDAMHLEILTAARQGEIVAMRWKDVDFDRAIWHQLDTKNGLPHDVMLPRQAIDLLRGRMGLHRQWVFPRPDGKVHIQSKAVGIQQYAAKASLGFTDWTVHDLRRSALTGLARLGCPRVVQDRIANHVDMSMAAIYDRHSYDAEAKVWLQRWADHLGESTASVERPSWLVAA